MMFSNDFFSCKHLKWISLTGASGTGPSSDSWPDSVMEPAAGTGLSSGSKTDCVTVAGLAVVPCGLPSVTTVGYAK